MTDPRREPFDWLDDAELRHGGLGMIQTAIARGWLEGPEHAGRRARLVDALARLALDPATSMRESLQATRLLAVSMTAANFRMLDRSMPRRRKPRRRRMGKTLQGEGGPPCGPTGRAGATGPTADPPDRPTDRPTASRRPAHGAKRRGYAMSPKPRTLKYADALEAAEQCIVDALPDILAALITRAKGGDLKAAAYLCDRIMGRTAGAKTAPADDRQAPYTEAAYELDEEERQENDENRRLLSGMSAMRELRGRLSGANGEA